MEKKFSEVKGLISTVMNAAGHVRDQMTSF